MKKSLTGSNAVARCAFANVVPVSVAPLAAVLADVRSAFFGLCVQAGEQVLVAMMEAERTALCGAKGKPAPGRRPGRGGHTRGWVTPGGRGIAISRPRARSVADKDLWKPSPCSGWALKERFRARSEAPIGSRTSMGQVTHCTRNVQRWRDGQLLLHRVAAALIEAARGFRRIL